MNEIINSIPLREQIADIVREMIISGELKSEQKLSERQISSMLNVSTTPVKEAFRTLQAEGLIYSVPRKGSFVSSYSKDSMKQVLYLRSAVDGVAAFFAARFASEEEVRLMEQALKTSRAIIEAKGDSTAISTNNNIFHETVRIAAHNDFTVNLGGTLRSIDQSVRRYVNKNDYQAMMERQLEHEEILNCIRKKQSEKAEQLMIQHIRQTTGTVF